MDIQQTTNDLLVIYKPSADITNALLWAFGGCLLPALIFFKEGLFMGAAVCFPLLPFVITVSIGRVVKRRELWFDRRRNRFEIKRGQLVMSTTMKSSLTDLRRAIVQENFREEIDGWEPPATYRAVLLFEGATETDAIAVDEVFGTRSEADKLANAINAWLSRDVDTQATRA